MHKVYKNRLGIQVFPEHVFTTPDIIELHLAFNSLTSIPAKIECLTALNLLSLNSNRLSSIPKEIAALQQLSILYLENNRLSNIPEEIGELRSLTSLNISKNELTSLPDSIGQMTNLTLLSVADNYLTSLPDSIGYLTELRSLELSGNALDELPSSYDHLYSLTSLELAKNNFRTIPEVIQMMQTLTRLDLTNNHLRQVPDFIQHMTSLVDFFLMGNNFTTLDQVLRKNRIKNVINLSPDDVPAENPVLLKLRIRQELNNIATEIRESFIPSYQPPTTIDLNTFHQERSSLQRMPLLLISYQQIQPDLQNLEDCVQLPISEEYLQFQCKWITIISNYKKRLDERGIQKLRWLTLPISEADVVQFTKMTKRYQVNVTLPWILGGMGGGLIILMIFYLLFFRS